MTSSAPSSSVRPPAVAGTFYPGSAGRLQRDVDDLLEKASPLPVGGSVYGLVSPHAGYVYSGFTAAHAYKAVNGMSFDSVIVVGPSHQEYFEGISVYPGEGFRTPLGTIPIDNDLRAQLIEKNKRIFLSPSGHRAEHSVEVQLPFLQRVLGSFSFVPIAMGDQTLELCEILADAIASAVKGRNVLLVASSDLSHYHPYDEAIFLDRQVIEIVEAFDPLRLMDKLDHRQLEACGGGPIVAVMLAVRKLGATTSRVLHYCNSGDITGDRGGVVGYLSAAFSRASSEISPKVN
jgi:AmmeMemoRadiSam system protein B